MLKLWMRAGVLNSKSYKTRLCHAVIGIGLQLCVCCISLMMLVAYADEEYTPLSCERCPLGAYLNGTSGDASCMSCPSNSTTPDAINATAVDDCVCVSGYTDMSGLCVACARDTFKSDIGNFACETCPAHTHSAEGSISDTACLCAPGYHLTPYGCTECADATWKSHTGNDNCQSCDAAATSVPGATSHEQCLCNAGYSGLPGAACEACAAGKYREASDVRYLCTDCPVDSYHEQLASTVASDCRPCATNTTTLGVAGAASARQCICRSGYARADEWAEAGGWACRACSVGTHQPAANQSSCQECVAGKYTDQVAASADVCASCRAGTYAPSEGLSECVECGVDTWVAGTGSGSCNDCPSHSSLNRTGSSNVSDCVCGAGFRVEATPHRCETCAAGAYCPGRGVQLPCNRSWSGVGAVACTACAANSMPLALQGMTSELQCQCLPGTEGTHDRNCSLCRAGKIQAYEPVVKDVDGAQVHTATAVWCQDCLAGSYQPASGSTACLPCPAHSSAHAGSDAVGDCYCDAGFYGLIASDTDTCRECPGGHFCVGGQPEPALCRLHASSDAGRASEEDCLCEAGYYSISPGSECGSCPRGEYCSGHMSRTQCPRNSSSPVRSAAVEACMCLPGTWRGCTIADDGRYVAESGSPCTVAYDEPCVACPADTVCANETMWHCPEHSTAPAASRHYEACMCDDGYFNDYRIDG